MVACCRRSRGRLRELSSWLRVGVAPPPGQRGSASARQLRRGKSLKIFDWDGTRVIYVFLTAVALIYSISYQYTSRARCCLGVPTHCWHLGSRRRLMSRIPTISYSMGSSRVNVNSCVVWSHHPLSTNRHTGSVFFLQNFNFLLNV